MDARIRSLLVPLLAAFYSCLLTAIIFCAIPLIGGGSFKLNSQMLSAVFVVSLLPNFFLLLYRYHKNTRTQGWRVCREKLWTIGTVHGLLICLAPLVIFLPFSIAFLPFLLVLGPLLGIAATKLLCEFDELAPLVLLLGLISVLIFVSIGWLISVG